MTSKEVGQVVSIVVVGTLLGAASIIGLRHDIRAAQAKEHLQKAERPDAGVSYKAVGDTLESLHDMQMFMDSQP